VNIQVDGRSKHRFSDGHDVQNPAYALVSATLRYTVGDVELQAFVSNLLDKAYYVRGFGGFSNDPRDYYETPEPYYQWGEGRRFGVNARYRF
jgi:outer membrane receptor protein involved in Fe transport